jgi:hypothetical protein
VESDLKLFYKCCSDNGYFNVFKEDAAWLCHRGWKYSHLHGCIVNDNYFLYFFPTVFYLFIQLCFHQNGPISTMPCFLEGGGAPTQCLSLHTVLVVV